MVPQCLGMNSRLTMFMMSLNSRAATWILRNPTKSRNMLHPYSSGFVDCIVIHLVYRYSVSNSEYIRSVGPENLIGSLMLGKLNSLTELGSTGKSGSFFYFT